MTRILKTEDGLRFYQTLKEQALSKLSKNYKLKAKDLVLPTDLIKQVRDRDLGKVLSDIKDTAISGAQLHALLENLLYKNTKPEDLDLFFSRLEKSSEEFVDFVFSRKEKPRKALQKYCNALFKSSKAKSNFDQELDSKTLEKFRVWLNYHENKKEFFFTGMKTQGHLASIQQLSAGLRRAIPAKSRFWDPSPQLKLLYKDYLKNLAKLQSSLSAAAKSL